MQNLSYNDLIVDEVIKLDFKPNKLPPCETGPHPYDKVHNNVIISIVLLHNMIDSI